MHELRELTGLPAGANTNGTPQIFMDSSEHICDEDIAQITLANGIVIDAGQYGHEPSLFRTVVCAPCGHWHVIESSLAKDTEDMVADIVRLAHKYDGGWYADVAILMGSECDESACYGNN